MSLTEKLNALKERSRNHSLRCGESGLHRASGTRGDGGGAKGGFERVTEKHRLRGTLLTFFLAVGSIRLTENHLARSDHLLRKHG